jgi:DNA-binding LacI/PurR family transcriptional regulator
MRRLGIPIVLVGNRIFPDGADRTRRDDAAFPFVGIDDFAAMGDAVARLLRLGYSRIVYVAPSLAHRGRANLDAQEQRLAGALAAAAAAALADRRPADNGAERGCADRGPAFTLVDRHPEPASMEALIPGPEPRTAVVCSSDLYALRLLSQFQARGFEFPRDLGLMGFDNLDFLSYLQPHLSTVDLPMEEVGREAVRVLLDGLSGKGSAPAVLAHRFILGQTLRDHGPA